MIQDVKISKLKTMSDSRGKVMHMLINDSPVFESFGEVYFSEVEFKSIKAWKRHKDMTLNLIVPFGKIKFVLFDDRVESIKKFQEVIISLDNYYRLTVPPMVWMGFQGLSSKGSIVLNVANIVHSDDEVDRKKINEINYDWSK